MAPTRVAVLRVVTVAIILRPAASVSVVGAVDWAASIAEPLHAVPSVQVVSQNLLFRGSPVSKASFESLAALGAVSQRFAAWFPYARAGVAELAPPSGAHLCGPAAWGSGPQVNPFNLSCGSSTISAVDFASWGTPTGTCGAYSVNAACHAANSTAIVSAACLGRSQCTLTPSAFGPSPCGGGTVRLAVQLQCADDAARHTSWDFSYMDAFFSDWWAAANGGASSPIVGWCTAPTWLYDATSYAFADNASTPWYGYNTGTAPAGNLTALGDYYGRVAAWYMRGGFTDEYGARHDSGHAYPIEWWEVFNEPDYEHGRTPESYTLEFDAVVRGVWRWADPGKTLRFNGMGLPNIDDTPKVVQWATYFLNASNHAPDVAGDARAMAAIGYHAYPTGSSFTSNPDTYAGFFTYVDAEFVPKVVAVDAVIARLSPATRTLLDECGTDADGALGPGGPPGNNPRYWVASGSYFVYLFARVATLPHTTVDVVGHSQLMDAPGQEPSVTLLDWTTGAGTAAYWATWLAVRAFALGDAFVASNVTNATAAYVQAFVHSSAPGRPELPGFDGALRQARVLLINKVNADVDIRLAFSGGAAHTACTAFVVSETTGNGPPAMAACSPAAGPAYTLPPYATVVMVLH